MLLTPRLVVMGGPVVPSPTLRLGSSGTAGWVSTAAVVPSVAVMVPPLRRMALAAMLIPSASWSFACTTYSNASPWTPTRALLARTVACLVKPPIVSSTAGSPFTVTSRSNQTCRRIDSPLW